MPRHQCNSGYGTPPTPSSNHSNENIDHTKFLFEDIRNLYLSDRRSFFGDYEEAHKSEVNLSDAVVITSFKILLKYIYTGQINLGDLEGEEVFELLRISDYFGISNLKLPLHEYLKSTINVENSWSFLAMTRIYKYNELEVESLDFIENNALGVLQSENFLSLSPEALRDILIRDSFFANELDIFRAVCRWIKKHQNDLDHDTEMKVLSAVRYPLMSINEAEADVRLSNGDYLINDHFLDSEISSIQSAEL
ncbi:BTB/POZ domain-containing protein 9-like [Adelges cooleyi]|uniref:BTB/POZ domain-containing protein 9-like n=1 Tax=Adelges cooleyi TaxID=133065 RepID=UPI002180169B|nr:BTB/POZ domain-containing protein 9-like [Adelges cooleyi]